MSLVNRLGAALQVLGGGRVAVDPPAPALPSVGDPVPPSAEALATSHAVHGTLQALAKAYAPMFKTRGTEIAAARDLTTGLTGDETSRLSFAELRRLADEADLIGIAIDDVKQRVRGLAWELEAEDGGDVPDEAVALLEKPDGVRTWDEWASMLVEELLVCDNATLFPVYAAGKLVRADVIDGATVTVLLDSSGRVPTPPEPAYEQRVIGRSEVTRYTTDQLWYLPQNVRVRSTRGYSATERVAGRAVIVWRKLLAEMQRWQKGGVPVGIIGTPDTMTSPQLAEYQKFLDDRGTNPATISRLLAVAGSPRYQAVTPVTVDKVGEELLIRIICKAFGVDPTALVSQVNYSTANALERWSAAAGVAPVLWFLEGIARRMLEAAGYAGVRLVWKAQRDAEAEAARVDRLERYKVGLVPWEEMRGVDGDTVDEAEVGKLHFFVLGQEAKPFDPFKPAPPPAPAFGGFSPFAPRPPVAVAAGDAAEPDGSSPPAARAGAPVPPVDGDVAKAIRAELRRWRAVEEKALIKGTGRRYFVSDVLPPWVRHRVEAGIAAGKPVAEVFGAWLRKAEVTAAERDAEAAAASARLTALFEQLLGGWFEFYAGVAREWYVPRAPVVVDDPVLGKADGYLDWPAPPVLKPGVWAELVEDLERAYLAGGAAGGAIVGASATQAAAHAYAVQQAAALLGMHWDGVAWSVSEAGYAVSNTVRESVQELVERALAEGWSTGTLNNELTMQHREFIGPRSLTIARTETSYAYNAATAASYEVAGVQYVDVLDGPGCLPYGHDDGAPEPDEDVIGVQPEAQAHGQVWSTAEAAANLLGHPNCGRVFSPRLA